jgi:hypothetical protein
MAKRNTRHKRRNKTRKMRGGMDELGVSDNSIVSNGPLHLSDLNESGINDNGMNESGYTTGQENSLNQSFDLDDIPHAEDDTHDLDDEGSLHLSHLNTSNNSGYTTEPDDMSFGPDDTYFGGKRRRKTTKKRRGKKAKKTRKNRRKQRGGICYGNGVGANSYEPNYSIYNTNMLKLFPYKP